MGEASAPGLGPWLEELGELDPRLRPPLAAWARALDTLFGPLRSRAQPAAGEPDGYDGLDRRGPFDRLLLSDLSLLDAAPDEFLRRVGTGELGYLRLELREPRRGRRVEVVFDAGPEQLGMPRLVQLAALFVIARRARLAGATLSWTVAQRPELTGRGAARDEIAALLSAASLDEFRPPPGPGNPGGGAPAAAGRKGTNPVAPPAPPEPDERWYLGPAPRPGGRATHWLELADVAAADGDRVDVTLHRVGRETRRLSLPHLPSALQADAFIAPFGRRVPVGTGQKGEKVAAWGPLPEYLGPARELRLLPGTLQLAVLFGTREVLVWSMAKIAAEGAPKARRFRAQAGDVVGVIYLHQHARLAWRQDGGVCLDGGPVLPLTAGAAPPPAGLGLIVPGRPESYVDAEQRMWAEHGKRLVRMGPRVLAVGGSTGRLYALTEEEGVPGLHLTPLGAGAPPSRAPVAESGLGAAFYGAEGAFVVAHPGHLECFSPWNTAPTRLEAGGPPPPPGVPLLAVRLARTAVETGQPWRYAPVWMEPETSVVHAGVDRPPLHLPRRPRSVAVDRDGRLLALVSEEGTVEVWSLETGAPLMLRAP